MSLAAARAGLKTNIAADAAFAAFEVYDYEPKDARLPAVVVSWPATFDPRGTYEGAFDVIIPVRFEIAWRSDEQVSDEFEAAMVAARDAIESDRTLGGAVDDLSCAQFEDIGARQLQDDTVVMTFTVPVEIMY